MIKDWVLKTVKNSEIVGLPSASQIGYFYVRDNKYFSLDDFLKQSNGMICFYSLKNPSFPEYVLPASDLLH